MAKKIPGYEGYQVTSDGTIIGVYGRPLRLQQLPTGYLYVKTKYGHLYAHQAVLLAWAGPKPQGQEVRHLDGNPTNNTFSNLAYGTKSENEYDKVRHGTHPRMKLSFEQVLAIRKAHDAGESQVSIAKRYGSTQGNIGKIVRNESRVNQ